MSRLNDPMVKVTRRRWLRLGRNNKGSVLLLVMIAAPIAAALFFSLIELVLISKRQAIINRNIVSYSAVLDGVIDYTNYAIKNRWCMTSTWTRDLASCDIKNLMSLERLTLDGSAITALRDLNAGDATFTSSGIVSETISTIVNVSQITSAHPLFNIIKNLDKTGSAVTQIGIKVKRVNNINIPRRGREIFLDVKVTLMSGSVIFRSLSAISATSRLMVNPRELNYFSLIVPRDLYLDGTVPGLAGNSGDIGIPSGTGGAGITFESPVFVNGDIHIPDTVASYTSATFTNRVILGGFDGSSGGRIMRSGSPFTAPNNGNMSGYLYSALPNFGGFKKGIDVDGIRDLGLDVLAGYNAVPPPANAAQAASDCIGVNKVFYRLASTNDSDLVFLQLPPDPGVSTPHLRFLLGLTRGNMFLPQELRPYFPYGAMGRAFLTDISTMTIGNKLNGQATMFFRFDSGSAAAGTALGGSTYQTTTPGTTNAYTTAFTLRPGSMATMKHPYINGKPRNGRVEVALLPVYIGGNPAMQQQLVELRVNLPATRYPPETVQRFSLYMKAFDLGVFAGRDRRYPADPLVTPDPSLIEGHSMEGWLHFQVTGGSATGPTHTLSWINSDGSPHGAVAAFQRLDGPSQNLPVDYPPPPLGPLAPYQVTSLTTLAPNPTPVPGAVPINLVPTDIPTATLPNPAWDYQGLVNKCFSNNGGSNAIAFKSIGWNSPFASTTRHSWHFAPDPMPTQPDKAYDNIPVSPGNTVTIQNGVFYVKSIISECIVPSSTTVAAGFMTCDRLVIQPRTSPLKMIGTFIVGRAEIDPSAVLNGISFRSIYHSQSTNDLIAEGILKDKNGNACSTPPSLPIWWPNLTNTEYDGFRKCNVISLRDSANPFTWTAVDPDCGIVAGNTYVQCQKHAVNYIVNEISRTSELQ